VSEPVIEEEWDRRSPATNRKVLYTRGYARLPDEQRHSLKLAQRKAACGDKPLRAFLRAGAVWMGKTLPMRQALPQG
jgi:hypothetical protein